MKQFWENNKKLEGVHSLEMQMAQTYNVVGADNNRRLHDYYLWKLCGIRCTFSYAYSIIRLEQTLWPKLDESTYTSVQALT